MRVLVLFEAGSGGRAALDEARSLAEREHAEVTVVGVAPQVRSGQCTGPALAYNDAVADSVVADLEQARKRLGDDDVSYRLLIEGSKPSLDQLALDGGFDLVLLPGRRRPFRHAGHPAAARLSARGAAEVRVVDARRSGVAG
jgi:nucleotide-binding universal stress UspA family protein